MVCTHLMPAKRVRQQQAVLRCRCTPVVRQGVSNMVTATWRPVRPQLAYASVCVRLAPHQCTCTCACRWQRTVGAALVVHCAGRRWVCAAPTRCLLACWRLGALVLSAISVAFIVLGAGRRRSGRAVRRHGLVGGRVGALIFLAIIVAFIVHGPGRRRVRRVALGRYRRVGRRVGALIFLAIIVAFVVHCAGRRGGC